MQQTNFTDIMEKNHMEIPWHDYTQNNGNILINQAGLIEKASDHWPRWTNYAILRNWCLARSYFHEQAFKKSWCNLYGRCRINVD